MIEGITTEGKIFRPSDWAERVCGNLSTFKNQRIYYSPLLRPSFIKGHRCIVVDTALKDIHPDLYTHIIDFANANRLVIIKEEDLIMDPENKVKKDEK